MQAAADMHILNRQTTAILLPKLFCGSEIYMDRAISIIIIVISPVILPKNDYVSKRKNKHRKRKFPESSKKSLTGSRRRLNNFQSDNDQSDVVVLFWFEMFQGSQVARDLARSVNLKSRNFCEFCLLISLLFTLIICEPCWIFDKIKSPHQVDQVHQVEHQSDFLLQASDRSIQNVRLEDVPGCQTRPVSTIGAFQRRQ